MRGTCLVGIESKANHTYGIQMPCLTSSNKQYSPLVASCLRGALPPVDLRAVCLVRAIVGGWGLVIKESQNAGKEGDARF